MILSNESTVRIPPGHKCGSETRKKRPDDNVVQFLSRAELSLQYISVMTIGELRKGVSNKFASDPIVASSIGEWVDRLEQRYANRVLPVNAAIASIWATLSLRRTRPVVDMLIAATALHHGLTLVTRNTHDFAGTGVLLLNPWQPASP